MLLWRAVSEGGKMIGKILCLIGHHDFSEGFVKWKYKGEHKGLVCKRRCGYHIEVVGL